jgi:asparagine synthase (glutamine-hydrolysing)
MCGIAGIASLHGHPVDPEAIKRMCDIIAHRGPDDAGYTLFRVGERRTSEGGYWSSFVDADFASNNEHLPVFGGTFSRNEFAQSNFSLALGHRRLSIIDLSPAGHQPMSNSDRRYWVVFNGEIYNFPELRNDLHARGHIFRTLSDTEVLLHLWEEYGAESLPMLNGMFAFAIYDRVTGSLTLVRDRFGVKPLYYGLTSDFLVFASEIKSILASGLLAACICPTALVEYFTFQNTYDRQTLFQNIYMLQPGEYLTLQLHAADVSPIQRYHNGFPLADPSLNDPEEVKEQVADSFTKAVMRQLISDVEVGSYLSGGMDSGSIVAVAGRSIPRLLTFTGGFDLTNVNGIEQGFDERKLAEQLSYLLQTEHYDVVLHSGDMPAAMEKITWHMDDLRVGMCHQNWYVAKLASRFVKVCLAGAGGDELFGGYPWRNRRAIDAQTIAECDQRYFEYWHRLLPREKLPKLFVHEVGQNLDSPKESFSAILRRAPEWQADLNHVDNILQRMFYFEFKTFLHGFLTTEDHISMAHGLETRVPFLDNDLVDLAWRIPPSLKINTASLSRRDSNGHIESTEGKRILRKAMERYLPKEFTRLPKQGFSPPDENWYRGPSMDYIKSILFDRRTLERPWFDQNFVLARMDEHFEGRQNHRLLIWSLLSFEWLQRHYIDKSPPPACSSCG